MAAAGPALRFGTDGVRGDAEHELTGEAVRGLGRATARVLGCDRPFLVARDTRESGPAIEAALVGGLAEEGCEVTRLGVLPTPGLAFLAQARSLPAAMISASHNPYRDNGIKLLTPGGRKLPDEVERRIEAEVEVLPPPAGDHPPEPPRAPLPAGHDDASADYASHLVAALEGRDLRGLRVVVDCAHGAAFEVAPAVLAQLGAEVVVRCAEPDGRNINAGCGSTFPDGLRAEVLAAGADAGLAFDGDADRLIAVDETGHTVDGDHLLAVAALDLRSRGGLRDQTVVTTVMANLGFRKAMDAHGISVIETRVGDRYVLEAMDAGGYSLGGEQSGHVIFADLATTGDGILSGLVLLDIVARSGQKLSELASVVTKLPQVLESVGVADRDGLDGAATFWREVAAVESELGADGRVLVRPSGTEPVVRVMVEATEEAVARRQADRLVAALVAALGPADG